MLMDSPMGKWLRVKDPTIYANLVESSVRIIPLRGRERTEHVTVPTEFFPLLLQTEGLDKLLAAGKVSFYMEEYGERWIFGYLCGEEAVDLWQYTKSTLPAWV